MRIDWPLGESFWFYQKEARFEQMAASASATVIDLIRKRSRSKNSQDTDALFNHWQ